jgi:2',3'-cyclic-nucleotide 2'-phosphodiesterase (5'-nucleotidase family)
MDLILEVERKSTGAQLASTAAFSLDASLDAGPVTVARLAALYPYDNTLRKIVISGQQLRDYLEFSARYYRTAAAGAVSVDPAIPGYNFDIVAGVDYVIDVSKPVGQRITRLEYQGRNVAPADSFTLALNNYRQTGGGGYAMLNGSADVDGRELEIRQLLIDEARAKQVLRPEDYFRRNWGIVPAGVVSQAYAAMRGEMRLAAAATSSASARGAQPPTGPRLRIVATNDVHGALEPRPDANGVMRGGAAYVAAAIRRAAAECAPPNCHVVLLDGGDQFQGTPASNLAFGRPMVEIFNQLGLAAAALGNHEFDWGLDTLRARMRQAHYAFLGANVRTTNGRDVPWIRDDTLIVRDGISIGVIGVTTRSTPTSTRASNVEGFRFDDPAPIIDSLSGDLRRRGANVVVVVAHAGAFCDRPGTPGCAGEIVDVARRLTQKVDAIIAGHTHTLIDTDVNGIPIVQARSRGEAIDVVDVPLSGSSGGAAHVVRDVFSDSLAPDPQVQRIVSQAVAAVETRVNRPVAVIAEFMPKTTPGVQEQLALGNLIADAMRTVGKGNIAVMNNGGIRAPLRAGPATYGSLFEVQPFGNVLYRVTVRGRDLRDYLERMVGRRRPIAHVSGLVVAYDSTKAPGARIGAVRMSDGKPLADDAIYRVVLNDFEFSGGDDLGFGGKEIRAEPLDIVDLDAIVDYLRALPQPVVAPKDARLVIQGTQ